MKTEKLGRYEIEKKPGGVGRDSEIFEIKGDSKTGEEINGRLRAYPRDNDPDFRNVSITPMDPEEGRIYDEAIFHCRDCTLQYSWNKTYRDIAIINPDPTKRQNAKNLLDEILN